jgi:hypothetical protein
MLAVLGRGVEKEGEGEIVEEGLGTEGDGETEGAE